jgi:hypothetical protein
MLDRIGEGALWLLLVVALLLLVGELATGPEPIRVVAWIGLAVAALAQVLLLRRLRRALRRGSAGGGHQEGGEGGGH